MLEKIEESEIEQAIVVSDLHVGLSQFRLHRFVAFLDSLDPSTTLILNGDVIDDPSQRLDRDGQRVIDAVRSEAENRRVYWTYGNHDDTIQLADPGGIFFCKHLEIGRRLLVVHGDDFDELMPKSLWVIRLLKALHNLRIRLGARPVHIAEVAKKWAPFLYRILTEEVKKNAVDCARTSGFAAITCGHTHYVEDAFCEGVRYINTGAWTEEPIYYLNVTKGELALKPL